MVEVGVATTELPVEADNDAVGVQLYVDPPETEIVEVPPGHISSAVPEMFNVAAGSALTVIVPVPWQPIAFVPVTVKVVFPAIVAVAGFAVASVNAVAGDQE